MTRHPTQTGHPPAPATTASCASDDRSGTQRPHTPALRRSSDSQGVPETRRRQSSRVRSAAARSSSSVTSYASASTGAAADGTGFEPRSMAPSSRSRCRLGPPTTVTSCALAAGRRDRPWIPSPHSTYDGRDRMLQDIPGRGRTLLHRRSFASVAAACSGVDSTKLSSARTSPSLQTPTAAPAPPVYIEACLDLRAPREHHPPGEYCRPPSWNKVEASSVVMSRAPTGTWKVSADEKPMEVQCRS